MVFLEIIMLIVGLIVSFFVRMLIYMVSIIVWCVIWSIDLSFFNFLNERFDWILMVFLFEWVLLGLDRGVEFCRCWV